MAISFSGSSCYYNATLANAPAFNGAKTVFLRYYQTTYGTFNQGFFNVVNAGSTAAYQIGTRYQTSTLTYLCMWNANLPIVVSVSNPPLNMWTSVAYTYDGISTSNLFVNGTLSATSTTAVQTGSGAGVTCNIGGNWAAEPMINSMLEDVRLYNRVLSNNEILSISNGKNFDSDVYGLSYWWKMNNVPNSATLNSILEERNTSTVITGSTPYPTASQSILTYGQPLRV